MDKSTILVIDDETNLLRFFEYHIKDMGYDVVTGETGADFERLFSQREYATVLLDMMLPDANGLELLDRIRKLNDALPVILITAYGEIDMAVDAMKRGAFDFLPKPVQLERLSTIIRNAVEQFLLRREVKTLRRQLEPPREFCNIIGSSPVMVEVYNMIESVAPSGATVMVTGESGTGKELVAQAIHTLSGRSTQPFVAISCAAIPRDLMESELLGHEKGAFTGAIGQYQGCFERAHEGTLFLDEICEMDLALQAKLLRVIQEQNFYRIGGKGKKIQVNVRIISATNQDPLQAVRQERFREDLFYRLNVVPIHLPALTERREDIAPIANHFLMEFSRENARHFEGFDLEALAALERYPWGGNVRELRNIVEQLVVLNDAERIGVEMLPEHLLAPPGIASEANATALPLPLSWNGSDAIRPFWQIERDHLQFALNHLEGNVQEIAQRLEISPATLYRKIEKYGLVK